MPYFSVVIPSYNRAHFLPPTIESVCRQQFKDFEVILIDDGSTDDTEAVLRKFTEIDKRINYFKIKNSERGAARNLGIQKAKGEWVVFLDSDDEFLAEHLSHLKELIDNFPNISVFTTSYNFKENGRIKNSAINKLKSCQYDYQLFFKGNPFACNICIKKNAIKKIIPFQDNRVYSGMEDWIFLFSNTWVQDFYHSDKITVIMNEHPERSMRFNLDIIQKRQNASQFILKNFKLSINESRKLKGYSYYFFSIHFYLEGMTYSCVLNSIKALLKLGFKKEILTLLFKGIIGRKWIKKIKNPQ